MKYEVIINNYQKGSKFRTTPTHKVVEMTQVDKGHHRVVYELDSIREKEFVEKVLAKKLKEVC